MYRIFVCPIAFQWLAVALSVFLCLRPNSVYSQDLGENRKSGIRLEVGTASQRVTRPFYFAQAARTDADEVFRWMGNLFCEQPGDYQFALQTNGLAHLKIDRHVWIEERTVGGTAPVWTSSGVQQLEAGDHAIEVTFRGNPHADGTSQINLFWRGPNFRWEPVPSDRFSYRALDSDSDIYNSHASDAIRVLRCDACHEWGAGRPPVVPSPDLSSAKYLNASWLTRLFRERSPASGGSAVEGLAAVHGRFDAEQTSDLVAWLVSSHTELNSGFDAQSRGNGKPASGEKLLLVKGCLACHTHGGIGNNLSFGGGDLSDLERKRPVGFVQRWLEEPESIDPNHRMPKFSLTQQEREDIDSFLLPAVDAEDELVRGNPEKGRVLAERYGCQSCHSGSTAMADKRPSIRLHEESNWSQSCLSANSTDRPRYALAGSALASAIRREIGDSNMPKRPQGARLLTELNCYGCHAREAFPGLRGIEAGLIERKPHLANLLPAARAPSLQGVGDKLRRDALHAAIARPVGTQPLRPWLTVRMPEFKLEQADVAAISDYLVASDRVPSKAYPTRENSPAGDEIQGERLLTSSGFGCTSCHAIGRSRPPAKTPLSQRAPNLSMLGDRIRKIWFDRWVRNPARMVPKMEMPSVQVPVRGICGDNLDRQLDAVWGTLNRSGFSPPDAEPTRFVLLSKRSRPTVLTDVLKLNGRKLIKPFLVGLPNGCNVLLDFERVRLAGWWQGMVAKQRTQGKTWFWEPGASEVRELSDETEFVLLRGTQEFRPIVKGQFLTEPDRWHVDSAGVTVQHRLHFQVPRTDTKITTVTVSQRIAAAQGGWLREIDVLDLPDTLSLGVRVGGMPKSTRQVLERVGDFAVLSNSKLRAKPIEIFYGNSTQYEPPDDPWEMPYEELPLRKLNVMPGFQLTQLPLRSDIMPTSLGWRPNGDLIVGSLKGRVWAVEDQDSDGLPEFARPISDDLAAPYGVYATANYVDVINKHALIRLEDEDGDGQTDQHVVLASGWGHTTDYHDWVVGLPRDHVGRYYVSIPCQQDNRSNAGAKYRGRVLRLADLGKSESRYSIEVLSRGHRFPMGIAMNLQQQLFVTDNQGNYTPFNELNHVLPGRDFGFINKLETQSPRAGEVASPAISIPHPWTRSVNGICFLETPPTLGESYFGPFEGHLVGCEYDTRRLIRMSLDNVDGWIQGAAYPLSVGGAAEDGFLGPINCGVDPEGDLYIANIRDSGWGGGNNVGAIVRAEFDPERLPAGIAEVVVTHNGFRISFTRPVDPKLAGDRRNYQCSSYRRIASPAYGGEDTDRRMEQIVGVRVAEDHRSVEIELASTRTGFVYEWKLKNLMGPGVSFFPSEAYYSAQKFRRNLDHGFPCN